MERRGSNRCTRTILLCIVLSMLLLRFLGSLRYYSPRQPRIILHVEAEGVFTAAVHLLCAPIQRDGEVEVAAIRLRVQHERKGNKHTLKHICCIMLHGTVIQFLHPSIALCVHSLRLLLLNLHPFILSDKPAEGKPHVLTK